MLSLSCKCVNNGDGAAVLLGGRPCRRGSPHAAGLWSGRAAIRAAQCMPRSLQRGPGHCPAPSSPCHPPPRSCRSQQLPHPATMLRAALLQLPRAFLPAATATAALRSRPLHAAVVCCQPPAAPPAAPKAPAIPPVKRISRGRCLGAWCSLTWSCAAAGTLPNAAFVCVLCRHRTPVRPVVMRPAQVELHTAEQRADKLIRVSVAAADDVDIQFARSSGAGGQNVNKVRRGCHAGLPAVVLLLLCLPFTADLISLETPCRR